MNTQRVVDALNQAIALEHTAIVQYQQHALLVQGLQGKSYEGFFSAQSRSALEHAGKFGRKVVALGGIPTVEMGAPVRQAADLKEMLEQDLALEKASLQVYMEAYELAEGDLPLRIMLENQIEAEQQDVDAIQTYLGRGRPADFGSDVKLSQAS